METLWGEELPSDPLMRRVILWRAIALLAACGKAPVQKVLMCLVMDVVRPPSDDELRSLLSEAREAVKADPASQPPAEEP